MNQIKDFTTDILQLQELCAKINRLRRHILSCRVKCAKPGYHLELDAKSANETTAMLKTLPSQCEELILHLLSRQDGNQEYDFSVMLKRLRDLQREPHLIFSSNGKMLKRELSLDQKIILQLSKKVATDLQQEGGPNAPAN